MATPSTERCSGLVASPKRRRSSVTAGGLVTTVSSSALEVVANATEVRSTRSIRRGTRHC